MSDKQFENEKENLEIQNLAHWSLFYAKEGFHYRLSNLKYLLFEFI